MASRAASGATHRYARFRAPPVVVACLLAVQLLPSAAHAQGAVTPAGPPVAPSFAGGLDSRQAHSGQDEPGLDEPGALLRAAVALADEGKVEEAATVLSRALGRWPEHPGLLAGLAGLRLRQGRADEAEALADRLVRIDPSSDHGWELLAASRYLQDDSRGALRAWRHGRPPTVRTVEVHVLTHDGPRSFDTGTDPLRLTGIVQGPPLTVEALIRGERRLGALPAASSARLGYRILPGRQAAVEGTVVLGATNPFTLPGLAAHAVRALAGQIHVVSADPAGRLELWELAGNVEGTLRSVSIAVAHPAPGGAGVWRWAVEHGTGRYEAAGRSEIVLEQHSGAMWSHADWITASLWGAVQGRIEVRPGRGIFAGAGMAWTHLPLTGRTSIQVEGSGWTKMATAPGGGAASDLSTNPPRFARLAVRAALEPPDPPGRAAPSGVALRAGLVAVSSGAPPDVFPRIGAGGRASVLMRARSDLDEAGVVRPLLPGSAWVHGGAEVLQRVGSVGPVGIGVAAFADAAAVLMAAPDTGHSDRRWGAVHLGVGVRARIPGIGGWLRADWGMDPVDGTSTISAAWVSRAGP